MNDFCLICDTLLQKEMTWTSLFFHSVQSPLCSSCEAKLEPITGARCLICSRSLADLDVNFIKDQTCMDCFRWEQDPNWAKCLQQNYSCFHYNEFLKEVMAQFKFRGDYALASIFASVLLKELKKLKFDLLVPIPLSEERLRERGFNQAEALAQVAGWQTIELLKRIHTEKQSKKSRKERLRQKQIFQFQGDCETIKGKSLLLIDDIYTTGTTLRHAAKELKKAGAKEVQSITVARG
ncbi:ComF family protein [Lederbergia sp. NSJ-179]|uniref:ComF family protein n=1 Tax=Lederbergia sp. NSJ-179 TaxID=2931402 RepID=UPI001FD020BA|nr:ComF family protein [Lederbergia sp. NSJ-179]MCJ7843304.1 ComF family protein [Lederbergia sp. NSJ-179]